MTNDGAINRLLYAILSQKCLKDVCQIIFNHFLLTLTTKIDWNKVAHDPILAQEITNGHAARMRYSRFKKQMDSTTSMPTRPRKIATPRRSRVEKKKSTKRELKLKNPKDSISNTSISFHTKFESQDSQYHPPTSIAMGADLSKSIPTVGITKSELITHLTCQPKVKMESSSSAPLSSTPRGCSYLSNPFLEESPTFTNSQKLVTSVIMGLESPTSSTTSLSNHMMEATLSGSPLYGQSEFKDSTEGAHIDQVRYYFEPSGQDLVVFGNHIGDIEDGNMVMAKREENYDAYDFF